MLSKKEIEFIIENGNADTGKLLLSAARYPGINVKLCVNCIEARRKIVAKLPQWHANTALVYPFPLSAEQCSSQLSGEYKREIIDETLKNRRAECNGKGADFTGGMGADTFYLSGLCSKFYYFERNQELCKATEYNLSQLGINNVEANNIEINNKNISTLPGAPYDFIFIDPARRSKADSSAKVISLLDYEPNIVELKEELLKQASVILVKVSPMADIKLNLGLLPETSAVYIVSVGNECKELLFLLENRIHTQEYNINDIPITAINIRNTDKNAVCINKAGLSDKAGNSREIFSFTFGKEENALVSYANKTEEYLYEPNKSLLKGGAFKILSETFGLKKLAPSTHLYTSEELIPDFPGKIYKIEETIEFNKKTLKKLAARYAHADLTARNFPLNTNELKRLSGIKDGGNRHIFATTLNNSSRILLVTCAVQPR